MVTCEKCQVQNEDGTSICTGCGAELGGSQGSSESTGSSEGASEESTGSEEAAN